MCRHVLVRICVEVTEHARLDAAEGTVDVLGLAKYTVPLHVALPFLIWWAGKDGEFLTGIVWMMIHVVFPFVLAVTYPWWRGQGIEMAALIVINHVVTFITGIGLIYAVGT